MSNPNTAEEIAKKNFDEWNSTTGFVELNTAYYFEILSVMEDAMQEHTAQTLDRLREKAEGNVTCYRELKRGCNERSAQWEYFDGYQQSMKDILQLIEEVSDDT